jgi:hypothetical protein
MKLSKLLNPAAQHAETLRKHLDKSPADEVFTGRQLAAQIGTTRHAFRGAVASLPEQYLCRRNSSQSFYGNPKAIAELRKGWGLK